MTDPTDGMVLMFVPGGTFQMGGYNSSVRPVTLNAFWIDRTEVTNAQFTKFVTETGYLTDAEKAGTSWVPDFLGGGSEVPGTNWQHPRGPDTNLSGLDDHPVIQVSWNDAQAYCTWAGRQLPTEAQWEYAMRGPQSNTYPWGYDEPEPIDQTANYGWRVNHTTAVGTYPSDASWGGTLDMAGNVEEWVNDWDGPYPPDSSLSDPTGLVTGTRKITRGGMWAGTSGNVRGRYYHEPHDRSEVRGFRCALPAGE